MTEIDVQAVMRTTLCSHPSCPDDAAKGESTCARHAPGRNPGGTREVPGYDPVNGCKIRGCPNPPANTRGIYAFLCDEHTREKRETAGRRQAWADAQPNANGQRERLGRAATPSGLDPIIAGQSVRLPDTPTAIVKRLRQAAINLERAQAKADQARADLTRAKRLWRDALQEAAR